jgi:hypothetical protein
VAALLQDAAAASRARFANTWRFDIARDAPLPAAAACAAGGASCAGAAAMPPTPPQARWEWTPVW